MGKSKRKKADRRSSWRKVSPKLVNHLCSHSARSRQIFIVTVIKNSPFWLIKGGPLHWFLFHVSRVGASYAQRPPSGETGRREFVSDLLVLEDDSWLSDKSRLLRPTWARKGPGSHICGPASSSPFILTLLSYSETLFAVLMEAQNTLYIIPVNTFMFSPCRDSKIVSVRSDTLKLHYRPHQVLLLASLWTGGAVSSASTHGRLLACRGRGRGSGWWSQIQSRQPAGSIQPRYD